MSRIGWGAAPPPSRWMGFLLGGGSALQEPAKALGAVWDGTGVRFSVFGRHAARIDLCLFDSPALAGESARIPMQRGEGGVFSRYVRGLAPGQLYAYRAQGPYDLRRGHRYNPAKLLIDPYALAVSGPIQYHESMSGCVPESAYGDRRPEPTDSAPHMARCVVVDRNYDWEGDAAPRIPWPETVLYECHVRGMTIRNQEVAEPLRGTFAGLASEPILQHLRELGVTSLELLPVHEFMTEARLAGLGLRNYWGYQTLGFFAPHSGYARGNLGEQVVEFKHMVKTLHRAGIEVIIDVVFNHTAETDHLGSTLSMRGLDNATYYRLRPENARWYVDFSGCGNTPDTRQEVVARLILDSLRYWVTDMHVDGFRFDLLPALDRGEQELRPGWPLLHRIQEDPVLSSCKLIAEPWDLGPDGYQLGRLPDAWSEWNGEYRDVVRRYWNGFSRARGPLASCLAGSSQLFAPSARGPRASVNLVTCHDGFTLRDLVTYADKHNEANGEEGRDGHNENWSANWGTEGECDDPEILELRERAARNLVATLVLSQGVPMLSHGDELGRTQNGNNNAYCQDDETTWVDWAPGDSGRALLEFTRRAVALRRRCPGVRRQEFFDGTRDAEGLADVTWLRDDGTELLEVDWADADSGSFAVLIAQGFQAEEACPSEPLLLLLNPQPHAVCFRFPELCFPGAWVELLRTAGEEAPPPREIEWELPRHSMAVLHYRRSR